MWPGWTTTIGFGLVAAVAVAGCAPNASFTPGTKETPRTVTVSALDSLAFDPARIQVRAGETVRFVVTNEGVLEHEFAIGSREELQEHALTMTHGGMRTDTSTEIRVIPGQTKELVFTFGSATDIGYGCMVPGHFPAGMSGSFDILQ
ncbi:MAG: plastocyanin/azurin family copper-binding protein [Chloroflexota bacterium]